MAELRDNVLIRIVDDDADFRQGLAFMLECKGWQTASYADAADFLRSDTPARPGALILDVRMPGMSGIELQKEMKDRGIGLPIIILTGHADVDSAVKTLKMGAVDFLQKPVNPEELFQSVSESVKISQARALGGLDKASLISVLKTFSQREKQVTTLLTEGLTNSRIAERLSLTHKTVQNYRNGVYGKLRAHNTDELLRILAQVSQEELVGLLAL